jgi:hypothetical protein
MTIRLSIDRFEGDRKQIAVLLADDGTPINFPKALLPLAFDAVRNTRQSSGPLTM